MTCKDCKYFKICTDEHKNAAYDKEGDSWANWCDDFAIIKPPAPVKYKGYTAEQGIQGGLYIYNKDGKLVLHAIAHKVYTQKELKDHIKLYLQLKDNILPFATQETF